jgi:hypothetical protein
MSEIAEKETVEETGDEFVVKRESEKGGNIFRVTVRETGGDERTFRIFATSRSNKILKFRNTGRLGQYEVAGSKT